MTRLLAIAALLLASSAAQAQYTFDYGGRTIRIDPDRGTISIPGVYDNTGRRARRSHNEDADHSHKPAPQQAKVDPQAPAAAAAPTDPSAAPATAAPESATTTANVAPADTRTSTPPASGAPAPQVQQDATPAAGPAPAAVIATAPAAPVQQQPAPSPVTAASSMTPLGVWLTEEKEGKVRIEQCGANLRGYAVDAKSNQNGEQVLINMKPGKDSKWSGRILDPNTGSTYDSTIALKGSDTLRVQGCAFGGMFCGGQTWSRLN